MMDAPCAASCRAEMICANAPYSRVCIAWMDALRHIRRSGEVSKRRTFDIDRVPDVYTKESRNRTEWGNHSTRTGRTKGTSVAQRARQRARRDKARKIALISELGKPRSVSVTLSFPGHEVRKDSGNSSNSRFPACDASRICNADENDIFIRWLIPKSSSSWFNWRFQQGFVISPLVSHRDVDKAIIKNANFSANP